MTVEPGGSLRERKKAQTRRAIHDAARSLLAERTPAEVTVDDICAQADVSSRTFFNYFPTKSAALLGLPEPCLSVEAADRFTQSSGLLLDDVCALFASAMVLPHGPAHARAVAHAYPELLPQLHAWLSHVRREVIGVVSSRTDRRTASLAVTLAGAALMADDGQPAVVSADALRAAVRELVSVAQ